MYSPNEIFVPRTDFWPKTALIEAQPALKGEKLEPERGIEPRTYALRVRCSTV
jgi:hypothetical protein